MLPLTEANVEREIAEYEAFCKAETEMEILCVTEDFPEKNMTRRERRRHREIVRLTRPHAK